MLEDVKVKNIWKILTIIFVILFSLIFFRENYPSRIYYHLSSQPNSNIRQLISFYGKFDCKNKIVFIGDSLIGGMDWNKLLGRNDILNKGINGDTTNGVLDRLDFYINQKPKSIFLMIGINDINRNVRMNTIKTNYSKIIDKILSNNIKLFIQSTLNTNTMERNNKVEELNNFLVEQCNLKSIQYVDVNKKLSENNILSPKYSNDGLHVNRDGYIVWKKIILPYINKLQ
jgi:lysophospholipase L1-like esterase